MEQSTNYKHTINFLISNIAPSIQPTQTIVPKRKCNECNKRRKPLDESHQIFHVCYKNKKVFNSKLSGNKVIDDFIRYTQTNLIKENGKMEFVPYDHFKNIEFIAEGGFSKIYKATWIDGPIVNYEYLNYKIISRSSNHKVVLKKLNDSKNVTSKNLNELKVFYDFSLKSNDDNYVSKYFGITQDPITQDIMIIMRYYKSGDLINYVTNDFYSISWETKLYKLVNIARGLDNIHDANIVHRDLHSGNIFFGNDYGTVRAFIGDLGISKSATESTDDDENYGIIPYMAPEIFQKKEYTKASDIYSFGMIMWELMTGRRPFWDRNHDINLIIEICDGLQPPIVTNAPKGYIELMKECWNSDPNKRPSAADASDKIYEMWRKEPYGVKTKIVKSSDIGPVTTNNPGSIYKSRPLSRMINSAMSLRSSRNHSTNLETDPFYYYQKNNNIVSNDKRKFGDDLIDDNNDNYDRCKRKKLSENEDNHDYSTKEDANKNFEQPPNDEYKTKEIDLDINAL